MKWKALPKQDLCRGALEPLNERIEVCRHWHRPMHLLAGSRMLETELGGVQGQARGAARIGDLFAIRPNGIDRVATDWVP